MNILIFDTETTSLDKPFCYNLGYIIYNLDEQKTLLKRDFVIEQIWHNLPLFNTAYYANKRPIYVNKMKGKKCVMDKWGYCTRKMRADIKNFNVDYAFAYNSSFDIRVFDFNCEWYKTSNPLDTVRVIDIRPFAVNHICNNQKYFDFCEKLELFTESGNYSTTAEAVYKYISNNKDFIEEHTALSDSEIETEILLKVYSQNIDITKEEECPRSLQRKKEIVLKIQNKNKMYTFKCSGYTVYKKNNTIRLKE